MHCSNNIVMKMCRPDHEQTEILPLQIRNASDDLSPLEYVRDSAIRAVRDREVNLSAPMYLLSTIVNRLGRIRVNRRVTEVYYNWLWLASYMDVSS